MVWVRVTVASFHLSWSSGPGSSQRCRVPRRSRKTPHTPLDMGCDTAEWCWEALLNRGHCSQAGTLWKNTVHQFDRRLQYRLYDLISLYYMHYLHNCPWYSETCRFICYKMDHMTTLKRTNNYRNNTSKGSGKCYYCSKFCVRKRVLFHMAQWN